MPDINLPPELQARANAEVAEHAPPDPIREMLLEHLFHALESDAGIILSLPDETEAKKWRFRFYNLRNAERAKGNKSFDMLEFTLRGGDLRILKMKLPTAVKEV